MRVLLKAKVSTGEYQEKSRKNRCWAAGSTITRSSPTTSASSPVRSVKNCDGLDFDQEARLGQALDDDQGAGGIGRLGEDLVAGFADQRAVGPVGDIGVG